MPDDTRHDTPALHGDDDTPTPATDTGTARWSGNALRWSAARAAKETGAARSTILEALKSGRLEGTKDDNGRWQITPEALGAAGFTPGKPTPPDPVPVLEDRDERDDLARLRVELTEARADARVASVERDAERRLRESAERERDLYRRMIEAPRETAPIAPQPPEQPQPMPTPHPVSAEQPRANVGRWRRAWNVARFG